MIKGFVKNQNLTIDTPLVVSDTINYLTAEFSFLTKDWLDTTKWAHFAQGDVVYDILLENNAITSDKGLNLSEGVWSIYLHGNDAKGMRVTTEVKTFKVVKTGVLNGEPLPTLPLTAAEQILAQIGALDKLETEAKENLVAAINELFNRSSEVTPEQIAEAIEDYFKNNPDTITGGYYTPEVTQVDENTMKVSFTASGDKMPTVPSTNITLPAGRDGQDGAAGQDGYTPQKNVDYFDGQDGVSPTVTVSDITGGHRITITDANGEKTIDVLDGENGSDYVLTEADKQDIADMVKVSGGFVASAEPPEDTSLLWIDLSDDSGNDVYSKAQIDTMFGSYITDIDTLVGGDG